MKTLRFFLVCFFLTAIPSSLVAQSHFETGLHVKREGKSIWYDTGFYLLTGVPMNQLGCLGCHGPVNADGDAYGPDYQPACIDCHPTGDFSRDALSVEQCLGCHGRQATEIATGITDVHRTHGMVCWDCHRNEEIHGDGTRYVSIHVPGAIKTDCSDCHQSLPPEHANKDPHQGKLHCAACHSQSVVSCYNCHFDSVVEHQIKRAKQPIGGFVFLLNREKDGKVGTGTFQSLTYKGKSFVAFAPYFGHTITAEGRDCKACHVNMGGSNEAIEAYNSTGAIRFATWNESDSTLSWMKGVVPLPADYEQTLKMDFLEYGGDPSDPASPGKNWLLASHDWDGQHMLFSTPLTREQMGKLGFLLTAVERLDPCTGGFALDQNFPNPFNPSTTIRYTVPTRCLVRICLFDSKGRPVKTLLSAYHNAGTYSFFLDAEDLSTGLYFYEMTAGEYRISRKLVVVR